MPSDKNIITEFKKRRADMDSKASDLTVVGVAEWVKQEIVEIAPDFQRRDRWDDERRSQLIESILINVPIPPVYLNQEKSGPYTVIDGKQRITALYQFVHGGMKLKGLKLLKELNGYSYESLPFELKTTLQVEPAIRAVIVISSRLPEATEAEQSVKYEVFRRLNTGGIQLEPQEIRNAIYRGQLNDLITKLAKNPYVQSQLKVRPQDEGYQKMKDTEYVLRFFALKDNWKDVNRDIASFLDDFMEKNKSISSNDADQLEKHYLEMVERAKKLLGEAAFRKWIDNSSKWRDQQNIAMFDAEAIALHELSDHEFDDALLRKNEIIEGIKHLTTKNTEFVNAISKSTGSRAAVRLRVEMMKSLLSDG